MFWSKKKILFSLILALGLATVSLALSDTWTSKTDMPTARRGMAAAVLNGKIYVIGGNPGSTGGLRTVEVYDPAKDIWTTKSPMPTARGGLSVSTVNGKIYAIGGMTHPSGSFNKVEEYDPATDTWTTKASMPTRRFALSTSAVNGKIYAIGGQGSWPNVTSKVEEYDPATDTWTVKADMPTARAHLSSSVVNGKIYAIGGLLTHPKITSRVEEYDPVTDTWTRKADMPTARPHFATSVLNGRIYAIGGATPNPDGPPVPTVEEYYPATDTWTTKADMPTARSFLTANTVNTKIYAIGGTTGGFPWPLVSTVEEYDPNPLFVDFNGDGIVDAADMCIIVHNWGTDEPLCDIGPMPWGDGIVDVQDLIVLAEHLFEEVNDPTFVAHWPLDEAQGNIAYDNVGTCDGRLLSNPVWQPAGGMVDGALQFDGIDDFILTSSIPNSIKEPFSILAWVKGGAPDQVVISQTDRVNWLCTDTLEGNLMTELKGTGSDGTELLSQTIITDGNWHRLGLVWDGSYRTLYVDNVAVAEDTQDNLEVSENRLYIGTGKDRKPGSFWSGLIDDVRIYNRALIP